jgi:hypothetical protein
VLISTLTLLSAATSVCTCTEVGLSFTRLHSRTTLGLNVEFQQPKHGGCHNPWTARLSGCQKSRCCLSRQRPPVLNSSGGCSASHTGVSAPAAADCVPRQLDISVEQYLQCSSAAPFRRPQVNNSQSLWTLAQGWLLAVAEAAADTSVLPRVTTM